MKKFAALLTALLMLVLFAACNNQRTDSKIESTTNQQSENVTPEISDFSGTAELPTESQTDTASDTEETASQTETSSETETSTTEPSAQSTTVSAVSADPSEWTKAEIVEFYKKAAIKSNPTAKSSQVMVLNKLVINNGEGALGFFTKILEPAIRSVVKKNALNFDGITGGFHNLSVSDTKSVKAYKSGEYTIVEMTLKNQTDGLHANEYDGTVGHAITVLGDISRVLAEFPQFNVNLDDADIAVNYVNASLKVKINKNGIIEKGTWQYTCDPDISNVKISGITVKTADAEIDYIITVGDGF